MGTPGSSIRARHKLSTPGSSIRARHKLSTPGSSIRTPGSKKTPHSVPYTATPKEPPSSIIVGKFNQVVLFRRGHLLFNLMSLRRYQTHEA